MYDILRDEYDIQIEFGDIGNIMAYISIGDRIQDIERLVGALAEISRLYSKEEKRFEVDRQMPLPRVLASPQEAFYADKIKVPIREAKRTYIRGVRNGISARNSYTCAG